MGVFSVPMQFSTSEDKCMVRRRRLFMQVKTLPADCIVCCMHVCIAVVELTRVVKRSSKIRLSKFLIVLVFDLHKSNIVSNTVLCN